MKKRLIPAICLFLMILSVLPWTAEALTPLDPGRDCSLTLHYTTDGVGFIGEEISIYRVAKANPDGTFTLLTPYSSYPVDIYGITSQEEWDTAATTLKSFITANNLRPTRTTLTDSSGTAKFTMLDPGLYLVMGITAENNIGIYSFDTFLIYLPTPLADGTYDYDVEAMPKCIRFVPKNRYKVVKLWKDTGYTSSRPKEVVVEIFKDGVLQETVTLNAKNNWTYIWHVPETSDGVWTVREKVVPTNYTVSIRESDGTFTVTNTRKTQPGTPPKTGDMFPLWQAVLTMCISGSLLVILGIYHKRKNK